MAAKEHEKKTKNAGGNPSLNSWEAKPASDSSGGEDSPVRIVGGIRVASITAGAGRRRKPVIVGSARANLRHSRLPVRVSVPQAGGVKELDIKGAVADSGAQVTIMPSRRA